MYNPLLILDFYKVVHSSQYPVGLTKMTSYYTPRMSRLKDINKVCLFGAQAFIKEYLIECFEKEFFNKSEEECVSTYRRVLDNTLGKGAYQDEKIIQLHRLGYLPLEIYTVPEGTRTAIGVPQIAITNTHPDFVWLVNTIETMLSCTMWHTQISAEVGYRYYQIVKKYHAETCDPIINPHTMLGDFSMRGQHSVESATKSSAAWALSFYNTSAIPAILYLEDNYNCNCEKDIVARGAISTEHSVMCSNFAIDGDEITLIKRLLTKIYPHHSFSMVSDSYDYDNLVNNILPQCFNEIMEHDGTLSIRGDSGDPVEVIAGKEIEWLADDVPLFGDEDFLRDYAIDNDIEDETTIYFHQKNHFYAVTITPEWTNERGAYTGCEYDFIEKYTFTVEEVEPSLELLGTVWALWKIFGGTINSKGYKVLNSHIKALYGDSITPQRCEKIYHRLQAQGFAASNVSLGVGSFSFMCLEEETADGNLIYHPYTRDTFGIAVKATYAEDANGKPIMIYKQPKAFAWKKSQKGCCIVAPDGQSYTDGHTWNEVYSDKNNLLTLAFCNGKMVKEYSLIDVRNNLYPEEVNV